MRRDVDHVDACEFDGVLEVDMTLLTWVTCSNVHLHCFDIVYNNTPLALDTTLDVHLVHLILRANCLY
jgi:hypothetical protein